MTRRSGSGLTEEESWRITCRWCGEPLRSADEPLAEFERRLRERAGTVWGVNVLSMSYFCSTRCADDYYGYDPD